MMALLVLFILVFCLMAVSHSQRPTQMRTCEAITVPLCKELPYNTTIFPNANEHLSQNDAFTSGIDLYKELVTMNCSDYAAFFLCSYYLPICALNIAQPIRPCRAVCEKVKSDCMPSIKRYRRKWPDHVRCEDLPVYETDVCVNPDSFVSSVSCQCTRHRLNFQLYQANAYKFALKVRIQSTSISEGKRVITALVQRVLQEGLIPVHKGDTIQIYSTTDCACPEIEDSTVDLLIAGHEDLTQNRLILSPETGLVERWERAWVDKFKKWERKLARRLGITHSRKSNKKRRRKDSMDVN